RSKSMPAVSSGVYSRRVSVEVVANAGCRSPPRESARASVPASQRASSSFRSPLRAPFPFALPFVSAIKPPGLSEAPWQQWYLARRPLEFERAGQFRHCPSDVLRSPRRVEHGLGRLRTAEAIALLRGR